MAPHMGPESRSSTFPPGRPVSRKAGKLNVLHSILYFFLGQKDPTTPRAPSWKLEFMSAANETALEGKNKTFYCLAAGRYVGT